ASGSLRGAAGGEAGGQRSRRGSERGGDEDSQSGSDMSTVRKRRSDEEETWKQQCLMGAPSRY
ncbi:hypothetical protein JOQ06_021901, partial [Pogonophryne albipinna]